MRLCVCVCFWGWGAGVMLRERSGPSGPQSLCIGATTALRLSRSPPPPLPASRALAAGSPFVVARENLSALLEQARAACDTLDAAADAAGAAGKRRPPRANRTKDCMHRELSAR